MHQFGTGFSTGFAQHIFAVIGYSVKADVKPVGNLFAAVAIGNKREYFFFARGKGRYCGCVECSHCGCLWVIHIKNLYEEKQP